MVVSDQFDNKDTLSFVVFGDTPNDAPIITSSPKTIARVRNTYSHFLPYTDTNVREGFDINLETTAPQMTTNIALKNGLDDFKASLSWSRFSVNSTYPRHLQTSDYLCQEQDNDHPSAALPFTETWRLSGGLVGHHIVAAPLADTDNNGLVNKQDKSTLLTSFISGSTLFLRALESETGEEIWNYEFIGLDRLSTNIAPAIADIDKDGSPDIIMVEASSRLLVAISSEEGRILWKSSEPVTPFGFSAGQVTLSDLDRDGETEILVGFSVFDNKGNLVLSLPAPSRAPAFGLTSPIYPVDIDLDDQPELIQGEAIRKADGTLIWKVPFSDGHTSWLAYWAFANFDNDPEPEMVLVERSDDVNASATLWLLDDDGSQIWEPKNLDFVGQPIVGDMDADGELEIFVSGEDVLFDNNGNEQWRLGFTRRDGYTAVAADLQGNGRVDIIVNRQISTYVYDGLTGTEIIQFNSLSPNSLGQPLVADLDGDGRIEIVTAGRNKIAAVSNATINTSQNYPRIRNQSWFQFNGLTENIQVNAEVGNSWQVENTDQIVSPATTEFNVGLPDFWVDVPQGDHRQSVNVNIYNRGTADYTSNLKIDLYAGDPENESLLIATQMVSGLAIREQKTLVFDNKVPENFVGEIVAKISPEVSTEECRTNNNLSSSYTLDLIISDHAGATARQNFLLGVEFWAAVNSLTTPGSSEIHEGEMFEVDLDVVQQSFTDDNNSVFFYLKSGPKGMTVDPATGLVQWRPDFNQAGIYDIIVGAELLQNLTSRQFRITVLPAPNQAPEITSTPPVSTFALQPFVYDVQAQDREGDQLTFSLGQAPDGMVIDGSSGLIQWVPGIEGPFDVTVVVSDGDLDVTQSFTITVLPPNSSPTITSSPELAAKVGKNYQYQVVATDPEGDDITYSLVQAPVGMTIDEASGLVGWLPLFDQVGNNTIEIKATDSHGQYSSQSYVLIVNNDLINSPPFITSNPIGFAVIDQNYTYDIQAVDNDGDLLTYQLIQGPSGMTVSAVSGLVSWLPALANLGVHSVVLQVIDGNGGSATQSYDLTVREEINQAPSIISEPIFTGIAELFYRYQVVAMDNNNDELNYQVTNGPEGLTIDNSGLVSWTPTLAQIGEHAVTIQVDDGAYFVTQSFTLTILDEPLPLEVTVGISPKVAQIGETVSIEVGVSGGFGSRQIEISVNGETQVVTNGATTFVPVAKGRFDVAVTVTDESQTVVKNTFFTVGDSSDLIPPQITIHSPEQHAKITNLVDIVASIQDENLADYFVALFAADQSLDLESATILARGRSNVSETAIAQFDPSMLLNGLYHILVQAEDLNGQQSVDSVTLRVTGDLKVGNFTITLEDKSIPLAGIPIRVTRTYDSRRKSEALDFGHGWSVAYQDVKVNESSQPTEGWEQFSSHSQFNIDGNIVTFPSSCTRSFSEKLVTITLPDGEVESFVARGRPIGGGEVSISNPDCTLLASRFINLEFEAQDGTDSELVSLDGQGLFLTDVAGGNLSFDIIETAAFDVKLYQLTTRAGFVFELDQYFGIRTIIDPNGNTLTYGDDGIVHSSGKSISFNRDAQGKIKSITDPKGNLISYEYSTNGNLKSVTDELGNVTRYTYNNAHGLLDIIDPLGRALVKNIYNDEGRLIAQEDNDGIRTEFNHDLAGRQTVVTDRLGRTTLLHYDDEGNVTSQVDALGNVTVFTFDVNGNQLTQTDALNRVSQATYNENDDQLTQTDALGNSVSFTYNTRGQELTVTDESGDEFTNTYDAVGNLLTIKDPQGNVAGNNINALGLPSLTRDALGNDTTFTYDNDGNKLTETNPLGEVTTFTYDANGNVLSESGSRTLADGTIANEVNFFEYDKRNRVVKTTDTLGHVSIIEYDLVGNQSATVDPLGRRTEFDYDVYGRLIETRYPDGSKETKTYDREGNLLTETDRLGRITRFDYDALNRLVKTTFPDGSFTQTEYDAVGQVVAEIDAKGNRTEHEYDLAGRRIKTTDALNNVHQFAYDVDGNFVSESDALGHTTNYTYDILDRRIQTTFHNSSIVKDGFDALARKTSATDQANVNTQFAYDALGRLTSVTDVLGQVISYIYDEAGNKLTQTDAEGRTTSWTYDALGRVLSRTLPMGQVETFVYDALGRQQSQTNFNGDVTTFTYTINDQAETITYADGSSDKFTYDVLGNRLSATNSQGTWTYSYDPLNRLASETKPGGEKLEYSYDANGNKTQLKITYANAIVRTETSTYDALNRLASVTDNEGNITTYGYDAVGNRTSVSYQNGTSQTYAYDSLNRLTRLIHFDGVGALINQYDYTLHATGRRIEIAESTGRTSNYTYDALYRLTDEAIVDPINGDYTANYQFDKVGNRLFSTINGVSTTYTYDENDRLTQEGGEHYTYDAMGNTLTKTLDSDITTYTYDARQKLTALIITEAGVTKTSSYQYNMGGIRIQKVEEGVATNFLIDSNQSYAQVIAEFDASNIVNVEYVFGDDLLSQKRGTAISNYHYDGLGSTRALTDASGVVTDDYYYDAFGVALATEGSTENDYLFTGEQFDSGLGDYYLRARYYDQGVGRFTQMDTWQGVNSDPVTLHKYLYANADPVNNIDPSGNFSIGEVVTAINAQARLVATATLNFGSVIAQTVGRFAVNSTLALTRNFVIQANRIANAGRKIGNVSRSIGRAIKEFRRFARSKKFRNSGKANHLIQVWGPSGLKTPNKNRPGKAFRLTKRLRIQFVKDGGPGRVFQIKYTFGKNGNPANGTGFLYRLDYQDYTTNPSIFRPHYHLCGGSRFDCKTHHYL